MSSAKSKNFRRRVDDGEDGDNYCDAAAPSAAARPKKLLSFAGDEDDEEEDTRCRSFAKSCVSRNPSSSHRITVSKDRIPPAPSSNVVPQAGTYTKEALLDLRKNTRSLGKPSSSDSQTLKESQCLCSDAKDQLEESDEYSLMSDEEIAVIGKKDCSGSESVYEDFNIEDDVNCRGIHSVPEDFNVEDDENSRAEAIVGLDFVAEDEEDEIWEKEQIRKGMGIGNSRDFTAKQLQKRPLVKQRGLGVLPLAKKGENALKALQDYYLRMKESYSRTISCSSNTNENLSALLMDIASLERRRYAIIEKFIAQSERSSSMEVDGASQKIEGEYL